MDFFDSMQEQTSPSAIVLFTRHLVGDDSFIAFGGFGGLIGCTARPYDLPKQAAAPTPKDAPLES
jgi:hypothetical protein